MNPLMMKLPPKLIEEGKRLIEEALDALSEFEASRCREDFRKWSQKYNESELSKSFKEEPK